MLAILEKSTTRDQMIFLPPGQLERKLYASVNKCLESIGGKWNRTKGAHVFDGDPDHLLDNMMLTGKITDLKKEYQYFPTPPEIADRMITMAGIEPGHSILEPSAGQGAISNIIRDRHPNCDLALIELNRERCQILAKAGRFTSCACGNFLEHGQRYDRIVMNPPFTRQQDIDHVTHAFSLLKPGGKLVSVVSESPFFRTTQKADEFRELVEGYGSTAELPDGAFAASGTMVATRIVTLNRPA